MLSGSAPLSAELIEQFGDATAIPVHQGYGLTEAVADRHQHAVQPELQNGSVGAALPGIEIKLLDEFGQEPEGDDPGEIWIRGANMFSGYWPDGDGGPDEDGWWGTGDVGFLDAVGRPVPGRPAQGARHRLGLQRLPERGRGRHPRGAVGRRGRRDRGRRRRHRRGGRRLRPPADGASAEAVADAVREHCAVRLARFKQPSRIEVVDELPLTVTGKVQKGRLRGIERRRALGLLE